MGKRNRQAARDARSARKDTAALQRQAEGDARRSIAAEPWERAPRSVVGNPSDSWMLAEIDNLPADQLDAYAWTLGYSDHPTRSELRSRVLASLVELAAVEDDVYGPQ
jgi:hypothetical protein